MIIPQWFKLFLVSFLVIGTMMIFFGFNNSNTVKLRELDASLGLIRRPKTSKVLESAKYIFRPVIANAQWAVSVLADIPRIVWEVIQKALLSFISKLIGGLIDKVLSFFGSIVDQIGSWINTVTGLKDNTASWKSAIAMKAYQVGECLNRSSESVVRGLFERIDPSKNSVSASIADSQIVAEPRSSIESCRVVRSDVSTAAQTVKNAVAALRVSNVVTESQQGNAEGFTGTISDTGEGVPEDGLTTGGAVDAGGTADDSSTLQQEGITQNIELTNKLQTSEQIDAGVENIAENIAEIKCVEEVPDSTPTNDLNLITLDDIRLDNNDLCRLTEKTNAVQELQQTLAQDIETYEETEEAVVSQAPVNCRGTGFVNFKGTGETAQVSSPITDNNNNDLQQNLGTQDLVNEVTKFNNEQSPETLNQEQCNNQDRMPSAQQQIEASAGSNSSSSETFDLGSIVDAIKEQIGDLLAQVVNTIFDFFKAAIAKFVDSISNAYVSNAVGKIVNNVADSARTSLQNLTNQFVDDL